MRSLALALAPQFVSLACLLLSSAAWSQPGINEINPQVPREDIERALAARERPLFFGAMGGIAFVTARHPELLASSFTSAMMGVHAGYTINQSWAVALEFTTVEEPVERKSATTPFASAETVRPQAGCFLCPALPYPERPDSGELVGISAVFGMIGPRVEFTPFGADGLYLSASAGFAFVQNLDARAGIGGGARAGYRLRLAKVITFSVEAGLQAQGYVDASAVMPYGAITARPYF